MIRGTTPTLKFNLPFNTNRINNGYVTFSQQKVIVLDKDISECTCDNNMLIVNLTQEETLKFQHGCKVEVQIKIKLVNTDTSVDKVIASNIVTFDVDKILKGGII